MTEGRNPFVLGKPIKDPEDFFGREPALRELCESILNMQPVALVGEHRCGNTSILYQITHPEVQARHLGEHGAEGLLFAFINAQLAADSREAFFRRMARTLRRADPEATVDFDEDPIDAFWLEDYLDDLADRNQRLVLLLDEFDVLAEFEPSFWEWFRGLVIEYDMSIVLASRQELGDFETHWGTGSPFFNMFRTIYIGSFTPDEAKSFLTTAGERASIDLMPAREAIERLAGRFPYYMQVAGSLFYAHAARGETLTDPETVAAVEREFRAHTDALLNEVWSRLPEAEREAIMWLAVPGEPESRDRMQYEQALPRLVRRGYVIDGRVFSSALADFARRQVRRIELNEDTGVVRLEKCPVDLPPKEFALLRFLLERQGEIVSKDEIAAAVWPEYSHDAMGVTDAMIQKTISRLRKEVDASDSGFQHIESIRGQGYRFRNASLYEVYRSHDDTADEVSEPA